MASCSDVVACKELHLEDRPVCTNAVVCVILSSASVSANVNDLPVFSHCVINGPVNVVFNGEKK